MLFVWLRRGVLKITMQRWHSHCIASLMRTTSHNLQPLPNSRHSPAEVALHNSLPSPHRRPSLWPQHGTRLNEGHAQASFAADEPTIKLLHTHPICCWFGWWFGTSMASHSMCPPWGDMLPRSPHCCTDPTSPHRHHAGPRLDFMLHHPCTATSIACAVCGCLSLPQQLPAPPPCPL